jgi:putative inorganic carbon (hco3(-)) transporter
MNHLWQQFTLSTISFPSWISGSYLHRVVGFLQGWRRSSWLMQWADLIGLVLLSLVLGLAPFVPNALTGILLIACAAFWALLTISDDRATEDSKLTPIHLLVLLYWGIAVIATAMSPVKQAALVGLVKLTLYLLLFALVSRVVRSPRLRSWLITLYLHITLIVSVYGLHQYVYGAEALATWVDPTSPLSKATRVYSYLGNPNLLAGYLVPAVAFSAAAFFVWRNWGAKLLALTMVAVNAACLYLTLSRGGWIGMAFMAVAFILLLVNWWSVLLPRFWRKLAFPLALGGMIGFTVLAFLLVEPFRDRVSSIFVGREDSSNNFRINVWTSVLEMIRDRPILGIGPGNTAFNKVYPFYQRARFTALSAYSIPLEIAVETGLVGLTCFLWFLIVTFNQGWTQLQRLKEKADRQGFWLMAAIATLIGMLGHGLVDTVWYRPEVSTLWWFSVAVIASYYSSRQPRQPTESSPQIVGEDQVDT